MSSPQTLVGKLIGDPAVPTPAAVLDRAAVERNCARMLQAVHALKLGWRAHIKTHKTTEVTRLQIGDKSTDPALLVVSTLLEAERILPLLREYQQRSPPRQVNVLYGFPLYASAIPRLSAVARALGSGGVSIIIDRAEQVVVAKQLAKAAGKGVAVNAFLKVDMGSSRSGVVPGSQTSKEAIDALLGLTGESEDEGLVVFHGLYCHAGHSYDAREPWASMQHLVSEYAALGKVAEQVREAAAAKFGDAGKKLPSLTLSVGASPTAATLQHPSLGGSSSTDNNSKNIKTENVDKLVKTLDNLRSHNLLLEVHAGVQPVLDLQQLATHAWSGGVDDLALTVVADVASIYTARGAHGLDEVLINAGCIALAREAVKDVHGEGSDKVYTGFGIVEPTPLTDSSSSTTTKSFGIAPGADFPKLSQESGWWQVGRISQEHGILTWAGNPAAAVTPALGQRLRLWPNHACITASAYGHFLVVDSSSDEPTRIVDVWERWNGW